MPEAHFLQFTQYVQLSVFASSLDFLKIFWTGVIEVMQYRIKSDACIKPCPCPDAPGAFLLQPFVLGKKVNIYLSSHFGFCFNFKEINITILLSAPGRLLFSYVWRIWFQGCGTAAPFKNGACWLILLKRLQLLLIWILFSNLLCSK